MRARARYTCPRCNLPYCSLDCYRGNGHASCSEDFYRECVRQELRLHGRSEEEAQRSMREILLRLRSAQGDEETAGTEKLLSRLAEMEDGGVEAHEEEVQRILHQLQEEQEEQDLASRLSGVNIDAVSGDELWDLLPEKEKQMFQQLVEGGDVGALVPVWRPWWEEHEGETLIQELHDDQIRVRPDSAAAVAPPPSTPVPAVSSLCASPSPAVRFTLLNVLYTYTFSLRLFNGDVSESPQQREFLLLLLSVSDCLGRSRTFNTFSESLYSGVSAARRHDPAAALHAIPALAHVLSGRSRSDPVGYAVSALAHMSATFGRVRADAPRADAHFRRACLLAGKKCTFLQAWATEGGDQLRALAREVWRESGRAREERERTWRLDEEPRDEPKERERKLIQEM